MGTVAMGTVAGFLVLLCTLPLSYVNSLQDYADKIGDVTFVYHEDQSLLLTETGQSCYFTEVDATLRARLSDPLTRHQHQQELWDSVRQHPGRVQATTLGDMRSRYQDVLADYHCQGKTVFTLDDGGHTCPYSHWRQFDADVAFLVDTSSSLGRMALDEEEGVLHFLLNRLWLQDHFRFSLITFDRHVTVQFQLNEFEHFHGVNSAISHVRYGERRSNTSTGDALHFVRQQVFTRVHGDRADAPNVVVVVVADASDDGLQTVQESALLHGEGAEVVVVAVGPAVDDAEVRDMTSRHGAAISLHSAFQLADKDKRTQIYEAVKHAIMAACQSQ